jgi:protein O-GlcNAc transferase
LAKISIAQTLLKAKSHAKKGEIEQAKKLYEVVIQSFPKNIGAQQGMAALTKYAKNDASQAPPQEVIDQIVALYSQGHLFAAVEQAQALTEQYPRSFFVWNILGAANKGLGRTEDAASAFKRVTELNPTYADGFNNFGVTLQDQGRPDQAIAAYKKAISIKPDYADAYFNIGNALKAQVKLDEAIVSYKKALSIKPDFFNVYINMGSGLQDQNKPDEAIAAYNKALSIKPDYADAYNNIGNALKDQGKLDEAIKYYSEALSIKPDHPEAFNNMGNALKEQGKLDEAIESFSKALSIKPDYANAYSNIGNALHEKGRIDEAIAAYNKALSIQPDLASTRAQKLHQLANVCNWSAIKEDSSYLATLGVTDGVVSPFSILSLEDAPDRHRLRSVNYARKRFSQKAITRPVRPTRKPDRLRIGYFSADFYNHATMYLMNQVFAAHDKSRFEIFAYSYGPDKLDEMREKLVSAVDVFHDVSEMNDLQIVELARAEKLDIAIDLKGFTQLTRLAPFAYGLAPLQISYLGYPGSLGAEFIDYIVADRVVIPDEKRQYYSEQIIYLPNTYQPTDNKRVISDRIMTREELGLPSDGFVFCCFNNNYKISPAEFDIWMRLLSKVSGSVLWLLKSNKWAEKNLQREAETRGVSPDSLIFAEKTTQAEHLARHRLADLFLDTFNVNAHTTASDALWAGLPVVTKLGEGFASRVAGSLLSAIDLPELVTESEEEYEALALTLATGPDQLTQIKLKLEANRLSQPLFDSATYTRHLEQGYELAYERYFNGQAPSTVVVQK